MSHEVSTKREARRMPAQRRDVASALCCRHHTAGKLCDGDAGPERNDAWLLVVGRGERLARHPRPDAMHTEPSRRIAGGAAHDPLYPHIVWRERGGGVLQAP